MSCAYGTTESGPSSRSFKRIKEDEADWAYMEFGAHTNVRWIPQGDGTYECQFQVSSLFVLGFHQLIGGLDMRYTCFGS